MGKFRRHPGYHWPQGWHSRQLPYSKKEYEVRFNARYVLTVRQEIAEQTLQWLVAEFPNGIKIEKELVEPEWE